jgi:cobalt/nickel transport system permease protein
MSRIETALTDLRSLETLASRDTPLARLDARAKVLTTLVFIAVTVSFNRYAVGALLPLALFPVALAVIGDVPARTILRKLAIAAPFAVMVGLANPWLDRAPMLAVGGIDVSGGWLSFVSILLRFCLTVGAALVLIAGTGMVPLCAALNALGAPNVFTTQLLFVYRYAFVLGGEAARMNTARELRANGRRADLTSYGPQIGHLLLRAFDRARRIHLAMLARGFDGEVRSPRALRWSKRDTMFTIGWCGWFAIVRAIDLPAALGRLLGG